MQYVRLALSNCPSVEGAARRRKEERKGRGKGQHAIRSYEGEERAIELTARILGRTAGRTQRHKELKQRGHGRVNRDFAGQRRKQVGGKKYRCIVELIVRVDVGLWERARMRNRRSKRK
eukprot:1291712-Pleurochrysis_carterae.AAC.5